MPGPTGPGSRDDLDPGHRRRGGTRVRAGRMGLGARCVAWTCCGCRRTRGTRGGEGNEYFHPCGATRRQTEGFAQLIICGMPHTGSCSGDSSALSNPPKGINVDERRHFGGSSFDAQTYRTAARARSPSLINAVGRTPCKRKRSSRSMESAEDRWLDTSSGRQLVNLSRPSPQEIALEDIAGARSRICRFGGHTSEFDSVAQHSVLVSEVVADMGRPDLRLLGAASPTPTRLTWGTCRRH